MSDFVSWLWAIPYCGLFVIPLIWWTINEIRSINEINTYVDNISKTKPRLVLPESWCAGCDRVLSEAWMDFTEIGLYRCVTCRNAKDLDKAITYLFGEMEVNSDATQTVPSNNGHWEWTGMGREWVKD